MSDIFISYARKDQAKARMLADALAAKGWSVWWDPKIQSGKAFDRVIETAIAEAKCVVVVWSKYSVNSDWVRAEATNGLERGILISVAIDEALTLPLRFTQVHTENLSDWDGTATSSKFSKVVADISALAETSGTATKTNGVGLVYNRQVPNRIVWLCVIALLLALALLLLYRNATVGFGPLSPKGLLYLFAFGGATGAFFWGLVRLYLFRKGEQITRKHQWVAPVMALLLMILSGFLLPQTPDDASLTIRVLDKEKKAVTEGRVKLDLPGMTEQSISANGEVRFEHIPRNRFQQPVRISIVSPGYNEHVFDTLTDAGRPLEFTLTQPATIKLLGRIEDAGEMPIRDVEISVERTRFYTHSLTDGTFFLTLTSFAGGDEIVLRTSHPGYEDKLVRLTVVAPETQVHDIVLKPVN